MAMVILLQGCHDPKVVVSSGDPKGLLKLTARIPGDDSADNGFDSEIDYDAKSIVVVFPKNYPIASDDLLPEEKLKNIRLTASLSSNTVIEPALTTMDLTKTNYITVKNPQGVRTQYSIRGEIRDYWKCDLKEITLADGTDGIVVDEVNNVIMLVTPDATVGIPAQTAKVTLSPHATIIPDVVNEPFDFDADDAKVTVVAQNGVDKKEYTFVKGLPEKLPYGIDSSSARLMWVKKLSDLGIAPDVNGTHNGIGVTDDYVIINVEGDMKAVVLNAKTGEDTGRRLDMNIIPNGYNHSMTSDEAGNIIVNSNHNQKMFTVWMFNDIDDKGQKIYEASVYGGGNRLSIMGDVTKQAVALGSMNGSSVSVFRWEVSPGTNSKGEANYFKNFMQIDLQGLSATPWTSCDFAPTSITDPNADIFSAFSGTSKVNGSYGPACFSISNKKGTAKNVGYPNTYKDDPEDASNWNINACDYKVFNNSKYFLYNSVNAQGYGSNDLLFLMDVTGGQLTEHAVYFGSGGKFVNPGTKPDDPANNTPLPYIDINHNYGATAANNRGVAGPSNDVRLWVDRNGYYMYAYFMYANGYVGCVRVDCIKR